MLDFFVFIRLSVMIKIMYRNKSDREYYKRGNFYGRTLLLGPTLYWAGREIENGGHQMRLPCRHSYIIIVVVIVGHLKCLRPH